MDKQILLVDDEPQLLFSVKEFLCRVGYDVVPAPNGTEALDKVLDSPPDLIISDIMMDTMDGFEFQERVNALTGDTIPFIFLTAKDSLQDRLSGLRNGADDYIVKPFEPEELEARVGSIFHRIEQTRLEEKRQVERLRGRILVEVSKQLRAPVNSLTTQLNLLLSQRFGADHNRQLEYLQNALANASELRQLIDDLSWAASDSEEESPLCLEPVRVAPIIRSAAANAARVANEKGIEIKLLCGGLLSANLDAPAMGRALAGLLEAMVDMSPPGTNVGISARRAEEGGIEFRLADGGVSSSENDVLGWSPGALDLARRVVKGHGGKFYTRLEPEGACLIIWLPGRIAKHIGKRGQ